MLFACLSAAIGIVTYRYYSSQKEAIEGEVHKQLLSIADSKVTEISDWSGQWMDEAQVLMANRATLHALARLASAAPRENESADLRNWFEQFCNSFHYASATFVDRRGNIVLSVGRLFGEPHHLQTIAAEAIQANRIQFHNLHVDPNGTAIHMSASVPLREADGAPPFGALILGIDPAERLYPRLRSWPGPTRTGETALVRRDGDDAIFLNEVRFHPGSALTLRIPLTRRDNPAVRAVLGAEGAMEGRDYRGVPVFAAVRAVRGLPFFVVAKIDAEEVEAPFRRQSILLIGAALALIGAAGAGILTVYRRQHLHFQRERQALVGHYEYLVRFGNDIILLVDDQGQIVEANDRAVATYGYGREELLRMNLRALRHSSSTSAIENLWDLVRERGSMVFESVHQSRDGRVFPVEVSVRVILVDGKDFRQSIIRDISERKSLDESLRRMVDAHSAVIEASAAAIVSTTPDLRVITWNKAAERIFGWSAEEAIGRPAPFIPPDRWETARRHHAEVIQGSVVYGVPDRGQCKDGRFITMTISAAPLHDPDSRATGAVLTLLDTTEQTSAEEALRRNESLFRTTFEQAGVGITFTSLEGRYLRVNRRFCELTGYTGQEALGLSFSATTHPEDMPRCIQLGERLMHGEDRAAADNVRLLRKDGSVAWVHFTASLLRSENGEPLHFVSVVEDCTERVHAEEALRRSEERFRSLVETAPEAILVEHGLRILYANSAAVGLFGARTAADLVGTDLLERIAPDDRTAALERSGSVAQGRVVQPMERNCLRLDGTPFPVESSATPIDYDSKPAALVFLRDIGERRKTEAEKRRLEDQLLQSQKLESLGRLAGGVAHDFNNHLTVIGGYCDMLLAALEPDDPNREEVEEIRAAGERAGSLTQQLLAFSRKQMAEPTPLDLNLVVEENGKMLRRLIGERVEIDTTLEAGLHLVTADGGQMGQVLMNLAINARDAMPSGGRIRIETANVELNEAAASVYKEGAAGDYVRLSLADTGSGMSSETLRHIFEPFFTTKGLGVGTGLGLSTVYGIVRQSGGWIHAESRIGEGTRFEIYLPSTADAAVVREPAIALAELPGGSETVLVAEDQPEVRRLVLRILSANGYRLLEAANGPEALDISRNHAEPIDLLITDVIMPEMTGRDLATRLREARPDIKVLYVSGYTADVIGHAGVLDAGVEYLPKPFTPGQLALKVREVLSQAKSAGRILVVDDEDAVRTLLVRLLAGAGYEVVEARDGAEGLRLAAQSEFDLAITDLIMPGKEGIETIRELRRNYPALRIVAISGALDGLYLKTAELMGADLTLRKPVDCPELLRIVRDLLT